MIILATALFFSEPAPLEMPRAEAYLVTSGRRDRVEDRFSRADLWFSENVDGRWFDEDGRVFTLSELSVAPPAAGLQKSVVTRSSWEQEQRRVELDDDTGRRGIVVALSPVPVAEKAAKPHQLPRGYRAVEYWQGTNRTSIVCAYLKDRYERDGRRIQPPWRLAIWRLADGDDFDNCLKTFEENFLRGGAEKPVLDPGAFSAGSDDAVLSERDLLRRDARHSVAAYSEWRVTDGDEFSVLDRLGSEHSDFIIALTNDLKSMRLAYQRVVPTRIDTTTSLAVARLLGSREEYLEALGYSDSTQLVWSAAYWSSPRRELVAYMPIEGETKLLETIRHEAFHQYLAYAAAFQTVSPWLNEGYAQYFEAGPDGVQPKDFGFADASADELTEAMAMIPDLISMDYREFYAGTDEERRFKYSLALSIAVFIEKGAPAVRFHPFDSLKADYFETLLKTEDMRKATAVAFKNRDTLKLFLHEWLKFWKDM